MGSTDLMNERELPEPDDAKHDSREGVLKSLDENDAQHGAKSTLQVYPQAQPQQQQSQGSVACWERFLHVRTIRVLLVEIDDCTRMVVSSLLRNCNYEVLEAANGLQSWKILEDLNNHIDIVLTEVDMPCVSGVSLLCKIMSHKTRKNIPVIMMSTLDSMGLVFRCLSKGAVDFLHKPIRKNELKNLWQHVWRRCHSSSGSGSESGTQTQKSVKSKCSEKSGSSASDHGRNDVNNGVNVGDGSDEGSGAQSSWTKQAVEVDSSRDLSPVDQVAECQDSTCAQVIRSNAEHSDNKRVPISVSREDKGQDLESSVERNTQPKSENLAEAEINHAAKEYESSRKETTNKLEINNDSVDEHKEPNLELSLKRHREVQDIGDTEKDERCVLRRSGQSAFSRYNNTSTSIFKSTKVSGNNSVLENSTEVAKRERQGSNGVSNNRDMGSTMNKLEDKFEATSAINVAHQSVRNDQQQFGTLTNKSQSTINQMASKHFNGIENQPPSNHDESSLKKLAAEVPHCRSTNVLGGPIEQNPKNYSLNKSNSGSNHGSNGQNGSSTVTNNVGNNAESDVGQAGKIGSGDASGDASGNRVDESKMAQREAALLKFRQKRKERCFEKRVRYQNRKRLAEQRPRVRGQFVKQAGTDGSAGNEDE